ncbi:MAG: AMIN domain-containing protein [Gemmatimonadaceae bacterium]|nr:AMIN domain-containing protein [Gemmatimonadaceae bacterium]NUQ93971.1 AMIN domain-containing protein [Gemmatimonadaceae bacterium]NUR32815.1 AMIN domain-containing protein [Gemmatimonadaceae bacterium]
MTRVVSLAALAAVLISAPARGMDPTPRATAVTSVSIVPATGKAQVVIGIAGSVDIEDFTLEAPYRIVLDLSGATLGVPPQMYDKVARGGIRNVRLAQYKKDVVRVVIDLDTTRSYSIDRGSNDVRVSISAPGSRFDAWHGARDAAQPVAERPEQTEAPKARTRMAAPATSTQPRITVTYQDADIRDVLAAFAAFSGRTIVVGKGVEGKITAEVRDQPWDVAMNAILQSQNLAAGEDNNGIITVDSYGNILAKQATEPLVTQLIPVNYTRASSLVETIGSLLSKDCPPQAAGAAQVSVQSCPARGSVRADTATNTLLVTEVPSRMNDLVSYVRDLDVRTPQVSIKAKIILVDRTDIQDIGIAYDFGSSGAFFNKLVQRPSAFGPIDTNGDGVPDATRPTEYFDPSKTPSVFRVGGNSLAAIANANQRVANPALSLLFSTTLGKFSLTSFIDALQEVRLADIQAEPSIVTLDNKKARIVVGEETPIRVLDANSAGTGAAARATVSFKESGIILEVVPHITSNRQILMTLHSERSSLALAASDLGYTFAKQLAENQLLVSDGETAVIGGLTVTQVSVSKAGIPLLVDLPLIGKLFGHTSSQEDKRDLLILVTPHIVDDGDKLGGTAAPR